MPWKEVSVMSQREHFYNLWQQQGHTVAQLCRLFGISRKTGYKWLQRGRQGGADAFKDRSKRPQRCCHQTTAAIEQVIIALRRQHPTWGGRKLKRALENQGRTGIPAPSTITAILRRYDLLDVAISTAHKQRCRFEHAYPNALWQMDFKGHFAMTRGRCHPLTVLDDHSRFNLVLKACATETRAAVEPALREAFEQYGLPERMTMDNGSPWGNRVAGKHTKLSVWLMDLGIQVSFSRPRNPQTQGKDERFHRTLKADVLSRRHFHHLQDCQQSFDAWRDTYNFVRPHDALSLEVPASRYRVSERRYQNWDTVFEYSQESIVRKVDRSGKTSFRSRKCFLGEAFAGRWVAVKPTIQPTVFEIYYRHQRIARMCMET
jgi:transposase InsO family protein